MVLAISSSRRQQLEGSRRVEPVTISSTYKPKTKFCRRRVEADPPKRSWDDYVGHRYSLPSAKKRGHSSAVDLEGHKEKKMKMDCCNLQHSSRLDGEVTNSAFGVQLSPNRALRVARLKCRFKDTIWKAEQEKIQERGGKVDPVKMREEKERLEMKIEAERRAAEAVARRKADSELKKQREREKEAARMNEVEKRGAEIEVKRQREREREQARIELENLERVTDFNSEMVEEVERLYYLRSRLFWGAHLGSPLEQLGLFLKAEYSGGDDDDSILYDEIEEGEII